MEQESLERKLGRLASEEGALRENNRIAKAILEGGFSPEIMQKLYKIISDMPSPRPQSVII